MGAVPPSGPTVPGQGAPPEGTPPGAPGPPPPPPPVPSDEPAEKKEGLGHRILDVLKDVGEVAGVVAIEAAEIVGKGESER